MKKAGLLSVLIAAIAMHAFARDYHFHTRYTYYSNESRGEVLIILPEADRGHAMNVSIWLDNSILFQKDTVPVGHFLDISFDLENLGFGTYPLSAVLVRDGKAVELHTDLVKLPPKKNGVRIDRLTGKLIVNGLPWFPFGFYCYSPVQPTLAEEEAVKGFNLMSPYQSIDPKTIRDREAYMDRCARLGMKVHYQLISLSGGGGVGTSQTAGLSPEERLRRMKAEIEHFRDHPALLAWYLSDEPTGNGISPDSLARMYRFVRSLDPYHPVTIVFMAPQRAREYADCMDIVMADPYPVPNSPVAGVGSVAGGLYQEFVHEKPVWIVPQAFGGGEWWGREPTPQEIRTMTYLSLVRGATGIQYFIRQPLNGFPKSTVTWNECGRISMEVRGITPFLLDGTPVPGMMKEEDGIWTNAWKLGEDILLMAVNSRNQPETARFELPAQHPDVPVEVLYENRRITLEGNRFEDPLPPLDARIYRLSANVPSLEEGNLLSDPGFESDLSYGVPSACYARPGADRGATAFLDSRTCVSGYQSLCLVTPETGKGMGLSFFPVSLNSGQSYRYSIYARTDTCSRLPEPRLPFFKRMFGHQNKENRDFRVTIGGLADQSFTPLQDWDTYGFYFRVPAKGSDQTRVNPYLELTGQGTAWFDNQELVADPVVLYTFDSRTKSPQVTLTTTSRNVTLRYNLRGRQPDSGDTGYREPFTIRETSNIAAGIFRNGTLLAWTSQTFGVHLAVGHAPVYEKMYDPHYSAGGPLGLVDGISGSRNYLDGRWQGFNGRDLSAVIDLDSVETIRKVSLGFLQNIASWIFMPLRVEVEGSEDGKHYKSLGSVQNTVDEHQGGAIRKEFVVEFPETRVRFVRIRAVSRILCPKWHNGRGMPAYIFSDEIAIE